MKIRMYRPKERGHMESLLFIAIIAILAALILPALARVKQKFGLTALETIAGVAVPFLGLALATLMFSAVRKVETGLKIGPLTFWTGKNTRQKLAREGVRLGVLIASGLVAAVAWCLFFPGLMPWDNNKAIFDYALLWALGLFFVSVALYYGVYAARQLQDRSLGWRYVVINKALRLLK